MPDRVAEQRKDGKESVAQDTESQTAECDAVEDSLARLRAAYEQYFMGLDRHPPLSLHTALRQRLEKLKASFVRNAALRFRIGNLAQKVATYERLWTRTLGEIENGTYRKDIFKVRRKNQLATQEARRAAADAAVSISGVTPVPPDAPGASPGAAVAPAGRGKTPAAPPPRDRGGLSDERVRALYDAYVQAKKQCKEDTSKLSMESLGATLRKQIPELLKRHQAQAVDFKVVVKDGKAILRAVPK